MGSLASGGCSPRPEGKQQLEGLAGGQGLEGDQQMKDIRQHGHMTVT